MYEWKWKAREQHFKGKRGERDERNTGRDASKGNRKRKERIINIIRNK